MVFVGGKLVRCIRVQVGIDKGEGTRIVSGRSMQYSRGSGANLTAALDMSVIRAKYRAINLIIFHFSSKTHRPRHEHGATLLNRIRRAVAISCPSTRLVCFKAVHGALVSRGRFHLSAMLIALLAHAPWIRTMVLMRLSGGLRSSVAMGRIV